MADDAPRLATSEAVDGVFERTVVERQLILLAFPRKTSVTDAVGEREQDWNAAARGPAITEKGRIGVKQIENGAVAHYLPMKTVEAERRPDFRAAAGAVLKDVKGRVPVGNARLGSRVNGERHSSALRIEETP